MTEMATPRPLPLPLMLAVATPTILVLIARAAEVLIERDLGIPVPVGVALWLVTTIPLVLLVIAWRGLAGRGTGLPDPDVQAALDAVAKAEQLVATGAATLARLDATLRERGAPPGGSGAQPAPAGLRVSGRMVLFALLATAGLAAGLWAVVELAPGGDGEPGTGLGKFIHEHATFRVYVEGEALNYSDDAFLLLERRFVPAHLHGEPYAATIHIEGTRRATFGEFFSRTLMGEVTSSRLVLDDARHGGAVHEEDGTKTLRLFVAPLGSDEWREVEDIPGYVLHGDERLLLTFGAPAPEDLEMQKVSVPTAAGPP